MIVREIITPKKRSVTVRLPEELVGKTVELIAFEIETENREADRAQRLERIERLTKNSLTDLSKLTFDRNEANNYDD